MIEPIYRLEKSYLRRLTEEDRLRNQVLSDKVRIGPEAAREIARRIEQQHGFWDFTVRRSNSPEYDRNSVQDQVDTGPAAS